MMRWLSLIAVLLSAAMPAGGVAAAPETMNRESLAGWCTAPLPAIRGLTAFYGTILQSHGYLLMVAPDESHASIWKFQFALPQRAVVYTGYAHARQEGSGMHLCMQGAAIAVPYRGSAHDALLTLDGTVNTTTSNADVTVAAGGHTYHFSVHTAALSGALVHQAAVTMTRVLFIFNHHRWDELYAMLIPAFRRQVSKRVFVSKMEHGPPVYLAVRPAGRATLTMAGQQPIRLADAQARATYFQPVIWTELDQKTGKSTNERGSIALALIGRLWQVMGSQ